MTDSKQNNLKRSKEITAEYFAFLDQHIEEVISGKISDFLELNQIAKLLHVSHSHLSDTLQRETGHHPCHFYDLKIVDKAKFLLTDTELSIAEIAKKLTYDPSNFGKFFKKWTGETPGNFRRENKLPKSSPYF
ncbi:MAG: helix-turn-helix transcriptional regulator [Chryseobacterium gambrini]|nr:helix-turn-helix transcriptional regulator [Chryseobacterium gambrini]